MPLDDDDYEDLMTAHRGLTDAQQRRLDAALVLLLAERLGDPSTLRACIRDARAALLTQENP
jgi:hypothetical protein